MLLLFGLLLLFLALTLALLIPICRISNRQLENILELTLVLPSAIGMVSCWVFLLAKLLVPPWRPAIERLFG